MEEERRKKITIMRFGVVAIMILILLLWVFNLRGSLHDSREKNVGTNDQEWQDMREDLQQTLTSVKQDLNELKATKEQADADQAAAEAIIDSLSEKTDKNTSGAVSTSTEVIPAPGMASDDNCPAYINCMPTIGEARPCQIPAGCEGITQIAY